MTITQGMTVYELVSLVLAGLALLGSVYNFFQSKRDLKNNTQMSFFTEYTRRYQEIEIGLLNTDTSQRSKYYRLYIDLCSEEYYLNSRNCLPNDVWKMWLEGMKLYVKTEELQTIWKADSQFYNDDFCVFFNNLIKSQNNHR